MYWGDRLRSRLRGGHRLEKDRGLGTAEPRNPLVEPMYYYRHAGDGVQHGGFL